MTQGCIAMACSYFGAYLASYGCLMPGFTWRRSVHMFDHRQESPRFHGVAIIDTQLWTRV